MWYSLMSIGSDNFSSVSISAYPRISRFHKIHILCGLGFYVCESQVEPGFLRLSYGATTCSSVPLSKAILELY